MTDAPEPEFFPLSLGGRTWNLPHLPFGVIKRLQPRVLALADGMSELKVKDLDEAKLDELLDVTLAAIQCAEAGLTRPALEALAFTSADLVGAQIPIMKALGLIRGKADPEQGGALDPKALSTTSSPA